MLYPLVWKSYAIKHISAEDKLRGEIGITRETLNPTGYIRIKGELWKASLLNAKKIEAGKPVVVEGMDGLVLLVKPHKFSGKTEQRR